MKKATAQLNNLRVSPRKVRLVTDQVIGMQVDKALVVLEYNLKKPADIIAKLLRSAIANSENNFKLKKENLVIAEIQVGEGKTLKRWMPRAYGRASKILKRTSKIKIFLEEIKSADQNIVEITKEDEPTKTKKLKNPKDVKKGNKSEEKIEEVKIEKVETKSEKSDKKNEKNVEDKLEKTVGNKVKKDNN